MAVIVSYGNLFRSVLAFINGNPGLILRIVAVLIFLAAGWLSVSLWRGRWPRMYCPGLGLASLAFGSMAGTASWVEKMITLSAVICCVLVHTLCGIRQRLATRRTLIDEAVAAEQPNGASRPG